MELDNPSIAVGDRILSRCHVAAELTQAGQYEAAREALGELWPGIGERPDVKHLPPVVAAEVLLQCGALTGHLGRARSVSGAQEKAQDLLSEAARKFSSQGRREKAAEAQCELGACYWRLGAHDDARVMMREALKPLTDADIELKARIHVRRTLVEISENRYRDALSILREAESVFAYASDALKGRWHGQKALVLRRLATAERRADYLDQAIIEYTAAIYHYEQAGHERYCGTNLNNLAFMLYKLGRHREAHEYLDRAQLIFTKLKDPGILAQVDETRARILVAEGKYRDAERIIEGVVKTFEQGGDSALLADALTVQGVIWSRLGAFDASVNALRRAMQSAQEWGAHASAGQAALTLIEEHGLTWRLSEPELSKVYARADSLLRETQDAEDKERLLACARVVIRHLSGMRMHDKNFSLYGAVHELESKLIEQALEESDGSVTKAARLLGLKHQTLIAKLQTKHKGLQKKRTPAERRLKSIIKKPQEKSVR